MEPTLKNGEAVAYTPDAEFTSDGIYVLKLNGELYIKRVQKFGNRVTIISDNKKYQPITITLGEDGGDMEILGKVVFWLHIEERRVEVSQNIKKSFTGDN